SRPIARDQMIVVVGSGHPWANRKTLKVAEIVEIDWVLREPGSGTRSVFEQGLAGFGIRSDDLRVAMGFPSNEAVRAAVEAGLGATATSASVAAPSIEAGLLHVVPLKLPDRCFYELHHSQRHRSRVAEVLTDIISGKSPAI